MSKAKKGEAPQSVTHDIEKYLFDCPGGPARALLERALAELREVPQVVVEVSGGMVTDVTGTREVKCMVMDGDIDGQDGDDLLDVPDRDSGRERVVSLEERDVESNAGWVGAVFDLKEQRSVAAIAAANRQTRRQRSMRG